MIQIPEDGWGTDAVDVSSSLLDGSGGSAEGSLAGWSWADEELASAPVETADTARERASGVFRRQRSIGAFNRDLDTLFAGIVEAPDWSDGLERFDRKAEELRQRHTSDLDDAEDREAFARHAGEFAAMQRIGLKRALVERQASDALSQLDDQLAYYAGKAAGTDNEVFRQIALDSGIRAIDELREAGYLTPEGADARKAVFLGQVDGADLEQFSAVEAPAEPVPNTSASPGEQETTPDELRGAVEGEFLAQKPGGGLTNEQIEQLEKGLDALLLAASLLPAGRTAKALRDAFQTLRGLTRSRSDIKPTAPSEAESKRPKLPTGGIKHIDPGENLATGRYAADKVLRDRGDVQDAMYRPDVGTITFNYGTPGNPAAAFKGGSGFSHVEAKHGPEVAREVVPGTLAYGRLDRMYGPPNARRADITHEDGKVTLSLFRDGRRETWVITGFEKSK